MFCTSLVFILLFGYSYVCGRQVNHLVNRRQINYTRPNYAYYPPNSQVNNFQPSIGNHLYPRLDFSQFPNPHQNRVYNATYNPHIDFSNWQIDPGFSPHYWANRPNFTYYPNIKFGSGNTNPIRLHNRNQAQNFSIGWGINQQHRNQHVHPHPNSNVSNFNALNYGEQSAENLISEINLPVPRTTCGKTLCSYVPNYPTKQISSAVDRARDILTSEVTNASFRNKGISLQTFSPKKHSPRLGNNNTSASTRGAHPLSLCNTNTNIVYPHEGFSSDDGNTYYVVNVPNLDQTLTNIDCDGSNGQTCSQRVGVPMSETKTCQQLYRKEQLLALPFGKGFFDIDDFQLQNFHVPAGCNCMLAKRGY